RTALALAFVGVAFAGVASAGEKPIPRSDVPKPVLTAIERHFPAAKQLGFERDEEKGKIIFEARLLDGARKLAVDLAPDGKLIAVEETIKFEAAPEAVRKTIASSRYGKLAVIRAEKVLEYKDDKLTSTAYEFLLGTPDRKVELVLDESGKITK